MRYLLRIYHQPWILKPKIKRLKIAYRAASQNKFAKVSGISIGVFLIMAATFSVSPIFAQTTKTADSSAKTLTQIASLLIPKPTKPSSQTVTPTDNQPTPSQLPTSTPQPTSQTNSNSDKTSIVSQDSNPISTPKPLSTNDNSKVSNPTPIPSSATPTPHPAASNTSAKTLTFSASGEYSAMGQKTSYNLNFSENGGPINGSFSGLCSGNIVGDFAGGNRGNISGSATGNCKMGFIQQTLEASFTGTVDTNSNAAHINWTSNNSFINNSSATLSLESK